MIRAATVLAALCALVPGSVRGFLGKTNSGLRQHRPCVDSSLLRLLPASSSSTNDTASAEPETRGDENEIDPSAQQQLLDFGASGSIGSLLLQMQRKEEALRRLNKTLFDKEQAFDLDSDMQNRTSVASEAAEKETGSSSPSDGTRGSKLSPRTPPRRQTAGSEERLPKMTGIAAKELDEGIVPRLVSTPGRDTKILELPPLYRVLREVEKEEEDIPVGNTTTTTQKEEETEPKVRPRLSRPEHYEDRIGRDMRQLAVSVALCVDNPDEWRTYSQQIRGGVLPLVECIREGANAVRVQRKETTATAPSERRRRRRWRAPAPEPDNLPSYEEPLVLAASNACRALRDACAISLDLAAVITDDLLRANDETSTASGTTAASDAAPMSSTLMEDLVTLLKHAHEADLEAEPDSRLGGLLLGRRRRKRMATKWKLRFSRKRREARLQCKLYVMQLLLAMACASDNAVDALRSTEGLKDAVLRCSSYARVEQTRRWIRYPGEMAKSFWQRSRKEAKPSSSSSSPTAEAEKPRRRPFIEATSVKEGLDGQIQGTANQILAAMGYNKWVPKIPGQKGLRILCLDGGGSRGMTSVMAVNCLVESLGGVEVADCFDLVVGTSTGAIIAFLVGLKRETSEKAISRYDVLIPGIFTKSALSTPLLLFTTASYDESPFMGILSDILGDQTMLDSRADPAVPYVFAVTSKMSSTPTHVALFRNYNYNGGELADPFLIQPDEARGALGIGDPPGTNPAATTTTNKKKKGSAEEWGIGTNRNSYGSRHPGSFRVLQRYALRASTAAPTVFKPVLMGGELYCDGGIVASNPTAIAIHEARTLFPEVPIELVVSVGTGGFLEQKSAPRIGWDGIIGQIVNSACDGEQIHHILEDILGEEGTTVGRSSSSGSVSNTRYMRFNPVLGLPDDFPIDITDPKKLALIKQITRDYMNEPEQQRKLKDLSEILQGRGGIRKWFGGGGN